MVSAQYSKAFISARNKPGTYNGDLMNLKGKLHQSRLVFSIVLYHTIDINKKIQYNNKMHNKHNICKKQTYNTITKNT